MWCVVWFMVCGVWYDSESRAYDLEVEGPGSELRVDGLGLGEAGTCCRVPKTLNPYPLTLILIP